MSEDIVRRIAESALSIYHSDEEYPELFIGNEQLQRILNRTLAGKSLDFPLRTRSKVAKAMVCEALGYPIPKSFKRTQPRFPGQNFDTYVQKSNNLQIWNEMVSPSRRYVLIRVDDASLIAKVKVVSGEVIADYDTTGTLTQKYQAKSRSLITASTLVSANDTKRVVEALVSTRAAGLPRFLPIVKLYQKLVALTGTTIPVLGHDQERNRGGALHQVICRRLGHSPFADTGQFPDIPEQLLEVKLQTSSTIDLGLVSPDGTGTISDMPDFRHCDVRYAIFYGAISRTRIKLTQLVLTTGADFFAFFQRFGGKILNKKLQIPLPRDFFD